MAVRSPYPNRLAYVPVLAALAAATAGAGIARAAQQGYTQTAWTGAVLGGAAAVGAALVGTPRWRAAFSRGYIALAAVAATAFALTHGYPRAEGLLFASGVLAASAFLMAWDELARGRQLRARLSESGLLDEPGISLVLEQYLDDLELPVARARANAPRLSQAIRALRRRRRSEAAAALQAYLEGLREYLDAVAAIRPPHLAALVGNTLERTFEFWTDAATKLAAGTSSAWKCRWQKLAWEIVEGDRQWVSAIDMLAAHHGVTPPQWFAEHRRQLRRTLVL